MANIEKQSQSSFQTALYALSLEREAAAPLHVQLADALRRMILTGIAPPGARVPASRALAAELSISRMTATTALDQLTAEGYLETRQGAGTYVASNLPHISPPSRAPAPGPEPDAPTAPLPFHPAIPDLAAFPHALWARHLERAWRRPEPALLALPDPAGYAALRDAIAAHLSAWRGLNVSAGQIIITSGATQAMALAARALLAPGDKVLMEDPGFAPMKAAMRDADLVPRPHAIDTDGFDIESAARDCPSARAVLVTPSRHYPLGITLPLPRRLALIDWAARNGAFIFEDDYDSEFRYVGQPLPALSALDGSHRTLYIGSFSKLLSPALRLGYLVVPVSLLPRFGPALSHHQGASLVPQPALANFMETGEFAAHLRKMRRLYAKRQKTLLNALAYHLPDHLTATPDPSGMHIVARPGPALTKPDTVVGQQAEQVGLTLRPLSRYFSKHPQQGFVLGYAGFDEPTLEAAVKKLAGILSA
ncbi:PLP-dependent aminotransferase family protein [Alisedimentitalea sp. MJ-SS2]|uniref:MocR-like pyridoxine biosynthesis transcription factor PdxR n=1 Tax=Aliisedimentitalea sp. MJ-SS2 TaxID=3049795 RepID=UPI00290911AD|nr:PLP-dependent aminotransferase family protein [Alisedimentitalea sp. MJ-SS2]MDU8927787.1 PLP-dependent aminotransferase family protein [Alisedimentitalea sp. MJ-SS2]